ncbi:MAG: DNA polymerase IV, partial [Oscillospiraceae bacterium]|nr:DNA polymerase IV [Oscillospiraceae bacterium]
MPQQILHSDLNSFYYSVEAMLDPSLRGRAVAVCGSVEDRHGIILAKSESAKRAGVRTGMALWEARAACPGLITVPPQYDEYIKYSRLVREIYYRYSDLVEPFGMDECWIDVTNRLHRYKTPTALAESIRSAVKNELGLTVSIGVSFNKIFAKLASDMKKPDAITEITPENFRSRVWPLPADALLYAGRATAAKLRGMGIRTIGELAAVQPQALRLRLGVNGVKLWRFAAGLDDSRVMHRDFVTPVKSVGHGITCVTDLENEEEVWKVTLELAQDVGHRLRVHELAARGVQISVRGNDLGGIQYQCRLPFSTQLPSELAEHGFR